MVCNIINSLIDIKEEVWNSIIDEGNIQMNYKYLFSIEQSNINDYIYRYLLVYDDYKNLIASLPLFITNEFNLDITITGKAKKLTTFIKRYIPKLFVKRVLFCGTCISEYNVINFKETGNLEEIINVIVENLVNFSKELKTSFIIFKDFIINDLDVSSILSKNHFFTVDSLPDTRIYVKYTTFDDYLKNLKLKHRQNIRNKINKNKRSGKVTLEIVDDFSRFTSEVYELYKNTYNKAPFKFETIQKDFFDNMHFHMGDNSKLILARIENKIVGYSLLACSNTTCTNVRTGLDYDYAYKYNIYFLLHYENIKFAIKNNFEYLYLSQTSYRPKLEMGAELVPLKLYVKRNNLLKNIVYKYIFKISFYKFKKLSTSNNPSECLRKLFPSYFRNDLVKN